MRGTSGKIATVMLCWLCGDAAAQIEPIMPEIALPPVAVPGLPGGQALPDALNRTVRSLAGARALRVDRLLREHREVLERVDDELVVRAEIIAIDITEAALKQALAEKFLLKRSQDLAELGVKVSVLQAPEGWSARRGLNALRKLDPQGTYDFNHVYLDGGAGQVTAPPAAAPAASALSGRVGLVDGGVDASHEIFANTRMKRFGCEGRVVPSVHGTAVASILVYRGAVEDLYAADVYCDQPTGGATDAVVAALAWMARERVAVINVSLVGPRNALLERVVARLVAGGFVIVAAVGNDGPAAPPLYPASYDGVVGVTAVDGSHRVLVEACRGRQVDFAAKGADMQAATQTPNRYGPVRGTSYAAPIIAALFAADITAPDVAERERALSKWTGVATDLGKNGRDDVYGAGELGENRPALLGSEGK